MQIQGGPMQGIKVLDIGMMLASPLAAGILADQGAEVIKVEAPGIGDIMRYVGATCKGVGALNQAVNRGKRSLALNLKSAGGLDILHKLVAEADVLTHNFRPGVPEKLKVDYKTLSVINPDLVYLSVTGFGHEGPMAGRPAFDNVVQAFTGVPRSQLNPETGEPTQYYQLFADKITAMYAAQAISAALFARARGAGGQHIQIAMIDAVTSFMWPDVGGKALFKSPEADSGVEPAKGVPLIKCRNGYAQAAPLSDAHFHGWCGVFGIDSSDPKLATAMDRATNRDEVQSISARVFEKALEMDIDEVINKLEAADVPCARANQIEELPEHPQMKANGLFVESDHPVAGPIIEPKNPVHFSETPSGCGFHSAMLGQHSNEILTELGISSEAIEKLREEGAIA